jgi:hypothetical protein
VGFLGRLLWRTAVRKGFFGGQRSWMTIFAVVGAVKAFRRVAGGTQDLVYREELLPGQALVITHHADVRLGDTA